jgi:hemerythrin
MPAFEWKSDYSVGDAAIDRQHQQLIAILNDLAAQLQATGARPGDDAQALFDRLARYVTEHFAYEEQRMADAGYPPELLGAHRREHDLMLRKVQEFEQVFGQGDPEALARMMPFLYGEWLIHHICGTDKDYAPYLAAG